MPKLLSWFEIPVSDFHRAKLFYEKILQTPIEIAEVAGLTMGMFSVEQSFTGGAIIQDRDNSPSKNGTIVYLDGGSDLSAILMRVELAGGSIEVPKTEIGRDLGYFAHFIDSEGNRVGLHSPA
jgi:hypothetical protein